MMQGPGYALTFLYYFSATAALVILTGIQGLGYGFNDRDLYQVAVPFALLVGSIGAYFNQNVTLTIPFKHKQSFQKQLQAMLQDLGYTESIQLDGSDSLVAYNRPGISKLLAGKIFIQLESKQVMISGRASLVNRLEKRLHPDS